MQNPYEETFFSRAVFGAGRLWLLRDDGQVSTILSRAKGGTRVRLPEPALDICASEGTVQALTCSRRACKKWMLRRWVDGVWKVSATVPTEGDEIAAIDCATPGRTTVLTDRRLIEVVGGTVSAVGLSETFRKATVTSIHVTSDHVFAGINAGEWGGGLRRIDRETGDVSVLELKGFTWLCEGPLNTNCDPVNGIVDEPGKPGCIVAAIGLVHFFPHGRIIEICGEEIRELYSRRLDQFEPKGRLDKNSKLFPTEAFFGLVRTSKDLVAVGIAGLYRFSGSESPTRVPLPDFKLVGSAGVSFAFPDVILVLTQINQRRSASGNVPLLVPR